MRSSCPIATRPSQLQGTAYSYKLNLTTLVPNTSYNRLFLFFSFLLKRHSSNWWQQVMLCHFIYQVQWITQQEEKVLILKQTEPALGTEIVYK